MSEVGGADQMPFSGGWSAPPVTLETVEGERDGVLHMPTVTPSYFSVMGIPILTGRGLDHDDMPMAYVPLAQDPTFVDNWVIRTTSDRMSLAGPFTDLLKTMDPTGTSSFMILDDLVHGSTAAVSARFSVLLLGGLSSVAGLLAVFGVYGLLAYLVQLRSREIGIQLALGAERSKVLGTIMARGVRLTGVGLAVGVILVLILGRIMESQLFGIEPWDPPTLALASLLVLGAALTASYIPARRAARTDPVEALRNE